MASIKITTGIKSYDIEDEYGNIRGQIHINPSDLNFLSRYDEIKTNITKYIADLNEYKFNAEDTDIDSVLANMMREYDNKVKKEINYLFQDDTASQVVFGEQNAFNTIGGKTYVARFIESIVPIIQEEFQKELQHLQDNTQKYVDLVN